MSFLASVCQQNGSQGLPRLVFGNLNQERVRTEFPGMRPPVLLYRQENHSGALYSYATTNRAVGWATQLPMLASQFFG